ncbi:MAG: hypothetical protein ACREEB_12740 [Caulobacteraceae bacterium]
MKFNGWSYAALSALALLGANSQAVAKVLVLSCKGTEYCQRCSVNQQKVDFDWTYTVDLSANTVDGHPARISNELITWQLKGGSVLDERQISRFSRKFSFEGKAVDGSGDVYYGDGTCEPEEQKAF